MVIDIPGLLAPDEVASCRAALLGADWSDGRETAGHQAAKAKRNRQLATGHPLADEIGRLIVAALGRNPLFLAAALPQRVLPPRFNRYEGGETYGHHIDAAMIDIPGHGVRIRTDISATLFFCEPHEYEGGELEIDDAAGPRRVKLPAGHLVIYPGTSLHRVTPVTSGTRIASFFWIQSQVREDALRSLLFELHGVISRLRGQAADHPEALRLERIHQNLLRRWSGA